MLRPVGSQSQSVYWRRRLLFFASLALLIVLAVLTLRTLFAGGGNSKAAVAPPTRSSASSGAAPTTTTSPPTTATSTPAGTAATTSSVSDSPTAAAPPCTPAQLAVRAVVGKTHYAIGDQPQLILQVSNTGPGPCTQDVADRQIELRVYNGASRVWGSHDCKIEPGTDERTLAVGKPAGFSITWSGLTSQPACAGTRQRVGAGTYTLYAALAGHQGTAAQFTIS
ncbi:MAG: hypothetical protein ACR2LF_07600 [Jatrophihabitantaceae bacterium]